MMKRDPPKNNKKQEKRKKEKKMSKVAAVTTHGKTAAAAAASVAVKGGTIHHRESLRCKHITIALIGFILILLTSDFIFDVYHRVLVMYVEPKIDSWILLVINSGVVVALLILLAVWAKISVDTWPMMHYAPRTQNSLREPMSSTRVESMQQEEEEEEDAEEESTLVSRKGGGINPIN